MLMVESLINLMNEFILKASVEKKEADALES